MTGRIRSSIAPAYLFMCLLLGGSAQGVWGNAALRLIAVALICWAVVDRRQEPRPPATNYLLILIGLAVALALLQMIPIPTAIWAALPGRAQFVTDFSILGIRPAALPLSLAPYDTLATLLALLPPLGMIAAMVGLRAYSAAWLAIALVAGTVAGVLIGILQVTSANPVTSSWYLYRQSNFGVATGFFANGNHMASLLLVTIPFIAALVAAGLAQSKELRLRSAILVLAAGGLVVVVLGLLLNGSLAGYGLGIPVVLASLLLLMGVRNRMVTGGALAAVGIASLLALALLWSSPVDRAAATSISQRQAILANSVELLGEFGPTGSGLGTYAKVYRLTEDPGEVGPVHVNHAHNDYLELAVETGLPGIALILLFVAWFARALQQMMRSPAADSFALAGAIASVTLLLHSVVDYPLRTAAMSAVFAMCLVLVVQSRRTAERDTDLRPVRHVVLG